MTGPADAAGGLDVAVTRVFARDGPIARGDERYVPREGQQAMARAVARVIETASALVAEAGTGVGKTYAYLVPVLLSGQRALLSTATKNLQDQLFLRDLPRLRDMLSMPVHTALLKGRSSYLCAFKLGQARHSAVLADRWAQRMLGRVEQWATTTVQGDLAEIDGLDERSPVLPLVTSTRENCLGSECPELRNCHVMKARRDAMAADVVVVNHHLFFADMVLRDTGVAELLPSVSVAVFDEAHQLVEAGVQFLATTLSTGQLTDLARDLLALGLKQARGMAAWDGLAGALEQAARNLRLAVGATRAAAASIRLAWDERAGDAALAQALADLEQAARACAQAVETVRGSSAEFDKLLERLAGIERLAARFASPVEPDQVRWIDVTTHQVRLIESPLDIREALREQMRASPKAWIFTSATLGDDDRLSWFTDSAGLDEAERVRVASPFDYAAHARLYVPRTLPRPGDDAHALAVAELAARCAQVLGGRTFVLTTTLRALPRIGDTLRESLRCLDIDVLVQGSAPKRALVERFLGSPRSVLVGSHSFWEGVDVPGDALQCVLIDKLPFPPPNDPLVQARSRRLQSQGRNAFVDLFVADAAVALKQGAGRLIRSETDRGLLVVCDPRLREKSYGRRLRQALPPMAEVSCEDDALAWLAELARSH
jgi:ATP-dependent DNA helicase DinG